MLELLIKARIARTTSNGEESKAHMAHTRLSRSLTCLYALWRLGKLSPQCATELAPQTTERLTLHIVGACFEEGCTADETADVFYELIIFVRCICHQQLHILLIGPEVIPPDEDRARGAAVEVEISTNIGPLGTQISELCAVALGKDAAVKCDIAHWTSLYDRSAATSPHFHKPDAIFCFNAGIWGYDSWADTLSFIYHDALVRCPTVITSYNWCEADDDEEVIQNLVYKSRPKRESVTGEAAGEQDPTRPTTISNHNLDSTFDSAFSADAGHNYLLQDIFTESAFSSCLSQDSNDMFWPVEENPFPASTPKTSPHEGEVLRDNHFWQCLGWCKSDC